MDQQSSGMREPVFRIVGFLKSGGHDYHVEFLPDAVKLRCVKCGRRRILSLLERSTGGTFFFVHAKGCEPLNAVVPTPTEKRIEGLVVRTFPHKGYCFIKGEDEIDYFAHYSHFRQRGDPFDVYVGQQCSFMPKSDIRGPQAIAVDSNRTMEDHDAGGLVAVQRRDNGASTSVRPAAALRA